MNSPSQKRNTAQKMTTKGRAIRKTSSSRQSKRSGPSKFTRSRPSKKRKSVNRLSESGAKKSSPSSPKLAYDIDKALNKSDDATDSDSDEAVLFAGGASDLPQSKLMSKFEDRLRGGHFRFLNQTLYVSTGKSSFSMFKKDPALFNEYHKGYTDSMRHWSIQPVDVAIRWLKKQKPNQRIIDYGCGEARIMKAGLSHTVTSLDLVALHPEVIACDMTQSPIEDTTQDIAIFSLSLMGTDYHQCILDAARVLKIEGLLWIAEVCSRFADARGKEDYQPFFEALNQLGFERTLAKKPSNLFVVFIFKKLRTDRRKRIHWPLLKPCLYKKR